MSADTQAAAMARATAWMNMMHGMKGSLGGLGPDSVDYHCKMWAEMYVSGSWTLGQLEAHCEMMLPVVLATGSAEAS